MSCSSARHKNRFFSLNKKYYIMVVMPMDEFRGKSELQSIQYQEKWVGSRVTCQGWPPPLLELEHQISLSSWHSHSVASLLEEK